ncbi:AI-2E family transporter [Polynucleobacter paludilacus]|uniref:AI-2E family transporter n=1 Tax=Polynucleobacter paludilacus TaxID=1855895 RepID=UPI001BFEDBB1|nr:AI-2E family transporter [Polynucleobacter paludilacus]QWD86746.1 AI-2E family transporter [Polynucleobacter paludilacus]
MAEIFTPFLAAFILAYILRPVCTWLGRQRLPHPVAALISMVLGLIVLFSILALFGSLLKQEIPLIRSQAPDWIQNIQAWLEPKLVQFHIQLDWGSLQTSATQKITQHLSDNADSLMSTTFDTVLMSGSSLATAFINSVLILFVMFYLLLDWHHFFQFLKKLIPVRAQATVQQLAMQADALLSQYLRGMFIVITIMATYYSCGLSLVGLNGAIPLGIFTALMIVIPYIGIALGFSLAIITTLLQFGVDIHMIGVMAVYGGGQMIEGFFLTPRLVGERIGLHPVAVLFALLFFGQLFGFFGVLLALPISAVTLVLVKFAWQRYQQSSWYQK